MNEANVLLKMIATFLDPKVRTATAYMSPTRTMRLTRVNRHKARERRHYFSLTCGEPNFEARNFIKAAKKAGESFPVKKIQLRHWPKKR